MADNAAPILLAVDDYTEPKIIKLPTRDERAVTVGRATFPSQSRTISREHAVFSVQPDPLFGWSQPRYFIKCLSQSGNGCLVQYVKIGANVEAAIKHDDIVVFSGAYGVEENRPVQTQIVMNARLPRYRVIIPRNTSFERTMAGPAVKAAQSQARPFGAVKRTVSGESSAPKKQKKEPIVIELDTDDDADDAADEIDCLSLEEKDIIKDAKEVKKEKIEEKEKEKEKKKGDEKVHIDFQEELECTLCYGPFVSPMSVVPCGHTYCGLCIRPWLDNGSNRCPECRTEVLKGKPLIRNFLVEHMANKYASLTMTKEELDERKAQEILWRTLPPLNLAARRPRPAGHAGAPAGRRVIERFDHYMIVGNAQGHAIAPPLGNAHGGAAQAAANPAQANAHPNGNATARARALQLQHHQQREALMRQAEAQQTPQHGWAQQIQMHQRMHQLQRQRQEMQQFERDMQQAMAEMPEGMPAGHPMPWMAHTWSGPVPQQQRRPHEMGQGAGAAPAPAWPAAAGHNRAAAVARADAARRAQARTHAPAPGA
ncbi:Tripartite motif-containing protein 65 [Saitoella coloradoensis]